MTYRIPDEVLDTVVFDVKLDGSRALALLSGASGSEGCTALRQDKDAVEPRVLRALSSGIEQLKLVFQDLGDEWPLDGYNILITFHTKYDLVEVDFCPKVSSMFEGISFEIADGGMYANGPGVQFFFTTPEFELVSKCFMR